MKMIITYIKEFVLTNALHEIICIKPIRGFRYANILFWYVKAIKIGLKDPCY